MPDRASLSRALAVVLLTAVVTSGCTQPGSQAPKPEAAKLSHATGDISLACGYAEELTAFGGPHAAGLHAQESQALTGARLLLGVWSHNRSWVYQGQTINGVVDESISLLGNCGLHNAQRFLQRAIPGRRG